VKICINRDGCTVCGTCVDTCPDLFELVDGETARITELFRTEDESHGEVFEDMIEHASEAADFCPEDAITVFADEFAI